MRDAGAMKMVGVICVMLSMSIYIRMLCMNRNNGFATPSFVYSYSTYCTGPQSTLCRFLFTYGFARSLRRAPNRTLRSWRRFSPTEIHDESTRRAHPPRCCRSSWPIWKECLLPLHSVWQVAVWPLIRLVVPFRPLPPVPPRRVTMPARHRVGGSEASESCS